VSLERIEITPFVVIAGEILQQRRTGYLTILRSPLRKVLYFSQGELILTVSESPADSLPEFLVARGIVSHDRVIELFGHDPNDAVDKLHRPVFDLSARQTLLRDWLTAQVIRCSRSTRARPRSRRTRPSRRRSASSCNRWPRWSSTACVRLRTALLRRSLGDLKRTIHAARQPLPIESLPLTEQERRMVEALAAPEPIEVFLRRFASQSVMVAKVVIAMLTLGVFAPYEERAASPTMDAADMQRDLELLAAIGSSDERSLRAVAFSRQMSTLDHYQILDVPRAATRAQIVTAYEVVKKKYDIATFPPIVRDSLVTIHRRLDEALQVLSDASQRTAYDKLIHSRHGEGAASIQQRLTQRLIAEQNYQKAHELVNQADYYGAIVLLKQAVQLRPRSMLTHGRCWARQNAIRAGRDAAESFQMALSIDPNTVEAMISLGDLYRAQGMISRAQTCYEDVLKISAENQREVALAHSKRNDVECGERLRFHIPPGGVISKLYPAARAGCRGGRTTRRTTPPRPRCRRTL
jgi:tetratricopeptide (TPR) repeat protein